MLAAAALRCVGGQFNGRLAVPQRGRKAPAPASGASRTSTRSTSCEELAKGDCIFAATGVTDGSLLDGVKRRKDGTMTTESVVMRASSGTVRWVKAEHHKVRLIPHRQRA